MPPLATLSLAKSVIVSGKKDLIKLREIHHEIIFVRDFWKTIHNLLKADNRFQPTTPILN